MKIRVQWWERDHEMVSNVPLRPTWDKRAMFTIVGPWERSKKCYVDDVNEGTEIRCKAPKRTMVKVGRIVHGPQNPVAYIGPDDSKSPYEVKLEKRKKMWEELEASG